MLRVLSTVNLEPLKVELRPTPVSFSAYNQLERELVDVDSVLYTTDITEVLIFVDGESLLRDRIHDLPNDDLVSEVMHEVEALLNQIEVFARRRPAVPVFLCNIALPPRTCCTFLNSNQTQSFHNLGHMVNNAITGLSNRCPNVSVLDWLGIVLERGMDHLIEDKFWYLARVRLTKEGLIALAREYKRLERTVRRGPRKVLLLDLDNTLWGGILGDLGISGIDIGEDGVGKAYREFQAAIKGLKETGVLLGIVSKNDLDDVDNVLRRHSMMNLRTEDFAAIRVNWLPKPENIISIAEELNVGIDSIVFLDDNPVERDLVRSALPDVAVPDFPEDVTRLRRWLLSTVAPDYFARLHLSSEDLQKTEQYRANAARRELATQMTVAEYLERLGMRVTVHEQAMEFRTRVAQLIQKTNQFNLTNRRHTAAEIEAMYASETHRVFALDYEDKFGKEGIIAAAIARFAGETASIDAYVMSCRVIGRTVEYMFLRMIVEALHANGVRLLEGHYNPTPRNGVAAEFYRKAGLEPCSDTLYRGRTEDILRNLSGIITKYEVSVA